MPRRAPHIALAFTVALVLFGPSDASAGSGTEYFYKKDSVEIPDGHGAAVMKLKSVLPMDIDPTLDDVNLSLRIKHPRSRDLTVTLKRPDYEYEMGPQPAERVVTLTDRDTRGKNLGRGACPGGEQTGPVATHTTFDDSAATSISDGDPPYEGLFAPAEQLQAFNGYHAAPSPEKETWVLRIEDSRSGEAGKLSCAGLFLSRF
jgi:hypothetical protein